MRRPDASETTPLGARWNISVRRRTAFSAFLNREAHADKVFADLTTVLADTLADNPRVSEIIPAGWGRGGRPATAALT